MQCINKLYLSTSVTGLQRCLDLLRAYGYKWGLHVNTLKTKAMVLTKQRYKTERFMYNGTLLECVKSFNYLGFEISHNGNFSNLINDRVLKAEMTSWKSCALPKGLVDLEKVHTNYMKQSLNINKHASNLCVYEELERFPITHRAWSMAIKY